MLPPCSKTIGLALLCAALCVAVMPLTFLSRGADPSTRLYQNAKGSPVPAAQAGADAAMFWKTAGVIGVSGLAFLTFAAVTDRRRRKG